METNEIGSDTIESLSLHETDLENGHRTKNKRHSNKSKKTRKTFESAIQSRCRIMKFPVLVPPLICCVALTFSYAGFTSCHLFNVNISIARSSLQEENQIVQNLGFYCSYGILQEIFSKLPQDHLVWKICRWFGGFALLFGFISSVYSFYLIIYPDIAKTYSAVKKILPIILVIIIQSSVFFVFASPPCTQSLFQEFEGDIFEDLLLLTAHGCTPQYGSTLLVIGLGMYIIACYATYCNNYYRTSDISQIIINTNSSAEQDLYEPFDMMRSSLKENKIEEKQNINDPLKEENSLHHDLVDNARIEGEKLKTSNITQVEKRNKKTHSNQKNLIDLVIKVETNVSTDGLSSEEEESKRQPKSRIKYTDYINENHINDNGNKIRSVTPKAKDHPVAHVLNLMHDNTDASNFTIYKDMRLPKPNASLQCLLRTQSEDCMSDMTSSTSRLVRPRHPTLACSVKEDCNGTNDSTFPTNNMFTYPNSMYGNVHIKYSLSDTDDNNSKPFHMKEESKMSPSAHGLNNHTRDKSAKNTSANEQLKSQDEGKSDDEKRRNIRQMWIEQLQTSYKRREQQMQIYFKTDGSEADQSEDDSFCLSYVNPLEISQSNQNEKNMLNFSSNKINKKQTDICSKDMSGVWNLPNVSKYIERSAEGMDEEQLSNKMNERYLSNSSSSIQPFSEKGDESVWILEINSRDYDGDLDDDSMLLKKSHQNFDSDTSSYIVA